MLERNIKHSVGTSNFDSVGVNITRDRCRAQGKRGSQGQSSRSLLHIGG